MCGIFGIVDLGSQVPIDEQRFHTGLATLDHRGPNGRRALRVDAGVILGHTRLSIIDLSNESNQPFVVDDRYWLTYNGEIFNYVELRTELEAMGVHFNTNGDTEVLLRAYIAWGPECVSRFNGMWAFAIWDSLEQTLFASRDRFGIKPFNYAVVNGQLLFASEIKALLAYCPDLAEPDYMMIANYCRTSVGAQHEQTWFARVKRLMPAHNLLVRGGAIHLERYWDYPPAGTEHIAYPEAVERYRAMFFDAVALRLRSDVPVGITLSSGVDSTSIAFAMRQQAKEGNFIALTAGFDNGEELKQDGSIFVDGNALIDEVSVARRVAATLNMQFEETPTDYTDFIGALDRIIGHLESGHGSPAVIPLMQLLGQARKHMTVVMDGQGADELLGGYINTVILPAVIDRIKAGKWRDARDLINQYRQTYRLRNMLVMQIRIASEKAPWIAGMYRRKRGLNRIYGPRLSAVGEALPISPDIAVSDGGSVNTALRHQHSGTLVNLLHYGDAISMANSLEARMPFLDHRLVELVWRMPGDFKVHGGFGKMLHRDAMRGTVFADILDNRAKHGFTNPISRQFRKAGIDGSRPVDLLLSARSLDRGLFDRAGLESLIAAHESGLADHGPLLFRLLSTELWFRRFVDA